MTTQLRGRCAVVTGAARGIGQAIAIALGEAGASVCVADLLDGSETVSLVEQTGSSAVYCKVDLQDERQIISMISEAESAFGSLRILVNNAAVQYEATVEDLSVEQIEHMFRVNLLAPLLASKHGVQSMLRSDGGSIVNVASVMGMVGDPLLVGYSAMKGGLIALTKGFAVSYAARGVRCNAIAPADVNTHLSRQYFSQFPDPAAAQAEVESLYPMKRFADPLEIGRIAAFLASDDSSYITGQLICADGGLLSTVYQGRASS